VEDIIRMQKAGDTRLFGEIAIEFRYINDAALKEIHRGRGGMEKNK
jgi:hypothetical protein